MADITLLNFLVIGLDFCVQMFPFTMNAHAVFIVVGIIRLLPNWQSD